LPNSQTAALLPRKWRTKVRMRPRFCFDVCWDAYRAARSDIDQKGGLRAIDASDFRGDHHWRPRIHPLLQDFCADFVLVGRRALSDHHVASRRALFEVYYVGLAEYERALRFLGISEMTWVIWTEQIRTLVGQELQQKGVYPVRTYFHEPFFHKQSLPAFDSRPALKSLESRR
jgi:hypothetical protein